MAIADRGMGTAAALYLSGAKISGDSNSITLDVSADVAEASAFEQTTKSYLQSLLDWTLAWDGFYSSATAASNIMGLIEAARGAGTKQLDFYPQGSVAGNRKWSGVGILTGYSVGAALADAVSLSGSFQNTKSYIRICKRQDLRSYLRKLCMIAMEKPKVIAMPI